MIEQICEILKLDYCKIVSKSRKRDFVDARAVIYTYLIEQRFTSKRIGEMFSRDHSTVLNGLKNYEDVLSKIEKYRNMLDTLRMSKPSGRVSLNYVFIGDQQGESLTYSATAWN